MNGFRPVPLRRWTSEGGATVDRDAVTLTLPLIHYCLAKSERLRQRHGNARRAAHVELPCLYLNQLDNN